MTEASSIVNEIHSLISYWETLLISLPADTLTQRRNSQNRTVKQILGHLIDSTSNNIHRIVHLQYQQSPLTFPNYATDGNNDRWIAIQNYQDEDWNNLVQLWKYSLFHFCHVIQNVDDSRLENEWIASPDERITLKVMIGDFNRHLRLHLGEIEELIKNG